MELWDCLNNKLLVRLDDAHDYKISCIKMVKKEYKDGK